MGALGRAAVELAARDAFARALGLVAAREQAGAAESARRAEVLTLLPAGDLARLKADGELLNAVLAFFLPEDEARCREALRGLNPDRLWFPKTPLVWARGTACLPDGHPSSWEQVEDAIAARAAAAAGQIELAYRGIAPPRLAAVEAAAEEIAGRAVLAARARLSAKGARKARGLAERSPAPRAARRPPIAVPEPVDDEDRLRVYAHVARIHREVDPAAAAFRVLEAGPMLGPDLRDKLCWRAIQTLRDHEPATPLDAVRCGYAMWMLATAVFNGGPPRAASTDMEAWIHADVPGPVAEIVGDGFRDRMSGLLKKSGPEERDAFRAWAEARTDDLGGAAKAWAWLKTAAGRSRGRDGRVAVVRDARPDPLPAARGERGEARAPVVLPHPLAGGGALRGAWAVAAWCAGRAGRAARGLPVRALNSLRPAAERARDAAVRLWRLPVHWRARLACAACLLPLAADVSGIRLAIAAQWTLGALATSSGLLGLLLGGLTAAGGIVAGMRGRARWLAEAGVALGFLLGGTLLDQVQRVVAPPILPVLDVAADGEGVLGLDAGGYLVRLLPDGVEIEDRWADPAVRGRALRFERPEDRALVEEAIAARPFLWGWGWFHPHRTAPGFAQARKNYAAVNWRRLRLDPPDARKP